MSEAADTVQFAASSADLPECNDQTEGEVWYVWSVNTYYLCETAGKAWTRTKPHGYRVAFSARPLDSSSACPDGGVTVEFGNDVDGDGSLDGDEMTSTADLCTPPQDEKGSAGSDGDAGATGSSGYESLLALAPEPPGRRCTHGGVRIETGIDLDADEALSADEVVQTEYVCDDTAPSGAAGAGGSGAGHEPAGGSGMGGEATGGTASSPDCEGDSSRLCCAAGTKLVGTAVDVNALVSDDQYTETLFREFSAVTPENAMKWSALEPNQGEWIFDAADLLVDAAESHSQPVKGHALVWHQQMPSWVSGLDAAALSDAVHDHITTTVSHYAGRVHAWDVVNEAIAGGANGALVLRPGIHATLGVIGLADAFKWAATADPDAILIYNDFGIEGAGLKSDSVYALMQALLAEGAPIDAGGQVIQTR